MNNLKRDGVVLNIPLPLVDWTAKLMLWILKGYIALVIRKHSHDDKFCLLIRQYLTIFVANIATLFHV